MIPLLSGCVTEYDRNDIRDFVREELGHSDFRVSRTFREFKETEDGYTDRIWTVTLPKENLTFHVKDDYHWGMETLCNRLESDYRFVVLKQLSERLPKLNGLSIEVETYADGTCFGKVIGDFRDETELKLCRKGLQILHKLISEEGYGTLPVLYELRYQHPYRVIGNYENAGGDSTGLLANLDSYEEMLQEYRRTALSYRYEHTDAFAPEEIAQAVSGHDRRIGIFRDSSGDECQYYEDIIAMDYYGVSFSSLYEILRRENFQPEGDRWHYRFTGSGGAVYEISYDFCDYYYDDSQEKGYYYLKDGEIVPMGVYFYHFFSKRDVETISGLRLNFGKMEETAS